MESYRPFIDDPAYLPRLDRQRFVVLRAPEPVASAYEQVRNALRHRLDGQPVSFPARPHVTLCGFSAGTDLGSVQELVRAWAPQVGELPIEIERVSVFPSPFQIVIVEVRRAPALHAALADLRARATAANLAVSTVMAVENWTFHMSAAYCGQLSAEPWRELTEFVRTLRVPQAAAMVGSADIVAFDEGREYSGGMIPLTASSIRTKR